VFVGAGDSVEVEEGSICTVPGRLGSPATSACVGLATTATARVDVAAGASATLSVGSSKTAPAVANGTANTATTASSPPLSMLCVFSVSTNSVKIGSRSARGSCAAAPKTRSASPRTSAINSGLGARPVASSLAISSMRRATWPICHSAGLPNGLTIAPCNSSPPRLMG
jgi:hypothetical protein